MPGIESWLATCKASALPNVLSPYPPSFPKVVLGKIRVGVPGEQLVHRILLSQCPAGRRMVALRMGQLVEGHAGSVCCSLSTSFLAGAACSVQSSVIFPWTAGISQLCRTLMSMWGHFCVFILQSSFCGAYFHTVLGGTFLVKHERKRRSCQYTSLRMSLSSFPLERFYST